jgi:23S rRNA pseudouridine1911/1915/1917 synthase
VTERWIRHTATEADTGRTVEEVLTGTLGISRRHIQKLTRSKGIELNRRPAFLGRKLRPGDVVSVRATAHEEVGLDPVPMQLVVVHEDAELLVLDKPPFVLVHPTSPHHRATLAHGVAHHFLQQGLHARVRPVHRLDRDTSGLLLVAKSALTHQRLDRQLRDRAMRREYLALAQGLVADDAGTVDAPIGRHKQDPNLRAVRPQAGEPARTRFQVVERLRGATLLQLELETGRTHQIRVHLAHRGHPVLGDGAYGGLAVPGLRRPALHAWRLAFDHPSSGEPLAFESPLPADLAAVRDGLRDTDPSPPSGAADDAP